METVGDLKRFPIKSWGIFRYITKRLIVCLKKIKGASSVGCLFS